MSAHVPPFLHPFLHDLHDLQICFIRTMKMNDKTLHLPMKHMDEGKRNFLLQTPKMHLPFGECQKHVNYYSFRDSMNKRVNTFYKLGLGCSLMT